MNAILFYILCFAVFILSLAVCRLANQFSAMQEIISRMNNQLRRNNEYSNYVGYGLLKGCSYGGCYEAGDNNE